MSIYKSMEFLNELELLEKELENIDLETCKQVLNVFQEDVDELHETYLSEVCKAEIKPEIRKKIDNLLVKMFGEDFIKEDEPKIVEISNIPSEITDSYYIVN